MGFSNNEAGSMTFVRLKSKKNEAPKFVIKGKDETGKWVDQESHNTFSGQLTDIETKEFEFEDQPGLSLITRWTDSSGDNFQIEQNFKSGITRSMINSLAGIDTFGEIALSLYVNKKGYPSIWVKNDGQDVNWHTSVEDLPRVEEIKNKKGEKIGVDDSEATDFYMNLVKVVKEKIDNAGLGSERVTPSAKQAAAASVGDDDLPF